MTRRQVTGRQYLMGVAFILTLIGGLAIVGTMEAKDAAYRDAVATCEGSAVACYVLKDEDGYAYAATVTRTYEDDTQVLSTGETYCPEDGICRD